MIRRVLRELLPPPNRDIRGAVRSEGWLRTAAGCESSADWQAVVGVLDRDLRLITPVDPWREASNSHQPNTECSYQLTHDYLVPLLRTWLTRKQRETRRGRAEIKLSELAQMWFSQPSSRFLSGIFEWAEFHLFTSRKHWNAAEKSIMQRANRRSGLLLTAALGFVFCAALLVGVFIRQRDDAQRQLVSQVQKTELGNFPALISKLDVSPTQLRSTLSQMAIDSPTESIRIDLALLGFEPHRLGNIQSQLLSLKPPTAISTESSTTGASVALLKTGPTHIIVACSWRKPIFRPKTTNARCKSATTLFASSPASACRIGCVAVCGL